MMKLENKIILVTGGAGLLGREIVRVLRSEGATTVSVDLKVATQPDLSEINCDLTNEQDINNLISSVSKHFGRIDGLVNNAYPRTQDWGVKFEEIPLSSWATNVDLQLNYLFYLTQQVGAIMKLQGFGSMVNMASIYGLVGPDFSVYDNTTMTMPAAYSAIKGGVINYTKYLASYLGPFNVRVNCVSPGGIFDNQNPVFVKNYESKVPIRRMGTPKDIAPAVGFLLSDESSYITGHNLVIDGGWTAI